MDKAYRVPELGEGVYEAELVQWLTQVGQHVRHGDPLAEVVTDKATMELPAPFHGTIQSLLVEPGQTLKIGDALLKFSPNGDEPVPTERGDSTTVSASAEGSPSQAETQAHTCGPRTTVAATVQASPAVRKMAHSLGVDLQDVRGTGPDGRVLIDDLSRHVATLAQGSGPSVTGGKRPGPATPRQGRAKHVVGEPLQAGERIALQGVRRSIAQHMVASKQNIPHYSYIDECDVSRMVALRNKLKRPWYARGVKLTNLPFYIKAVVHALEQVPLVNASLDDEAGEIILHDRYDIGIATATARGLVVPVLRGADRKNLAELARDIERLIRAAQAGTIARDDLQGSTFTISSIGNFGGLVSTPIIHHPEVGIVAIGKIFKRPTYDDSGEVVPAQIAYLSFSFDHRVVDGSVGAQFGNAMIQHLQDPHSLASGLTENGAEVSKEECPPSECEKDFTE